MPELIAAWLLYPLAVLAVCLGLGLLLGRVSGWRLPGALLIPVGFAALLAVTRLITATEPTAPIALPAILVLAVAGLVLGVSRLRPRELDPWLTLAALGVFAVYGAPVFASGNPSLAGYLLLPDTGHQLGLAALYAEHGPAWPMLADGAIRYIGAYVESAYPVAAQVALGVTAPLGVIDLAWLYQPFMTLCAVVLCLSLATVVGPSVPSRPLRALVVAVAAQPALLVSYALQGSIKEVAAASMLALTVALTVAAVRERRSARSLLPLAVAAAATLGSLGPAAGPMLAMIFVVVAVIWLYRSWRSDERRSEFVWLLAGAAVAVVLLLPVLGDAGTAVRASTGVLTDQAPLGNLALPLHPFQSLGIWFGGDYRYRPVDGQTFLFAVLGIALVAAGLGIAQAVRRRAGGVLLYGLAIVVPGCYLLLRGGPYADAKVLALMSVPLLLLALLGAISLRAPGRGLEAAGLTGLLVVAVVASNALSYQGVSLLPYDRYEELVVINERLAGRGPAILNEYDEFAKYFLRDVPGRNEPESPLGYRVDEQGVAILADEARRPSPKAPADFDDLVVDYVTDVPYLIQRRSPTTSRPSSAFELAWRGDYYDVWRRTGQYEVISHLPLGADVFAPAGEIECDTARELGAEARESDARLAYVERRRTPVLLTQELPGTAWGDYVGFPGGLTPSGPGTVRGAIEIPRTGMHQLWIEGAFGRPVEVRVDGRLVGTVKDALNNPGGYEQVGRQWLTEGEHRVDITYPAGSPLDPGVNGFYLRHIGPVVFEPAANQSLAVRTLDADRWRELCGKSLDWVEVVRPGEGASQGSPPVRPD